MSLISNYFKTLFRSFRRDLFYSFINLFGLAIGLASAFLIFIYIQDELGYDKHFKDHERIIRLESYFEIKGKPDEFAITQLPMGPTLKDEYPEVESFVRYMDAGTTIFEHNEEIYQEDSLMVADSNVFLFFGIDLLHGDPQNCLKEPNTMAISGTLAKKYFGKTNAVGQQMEDNNDEMYTVTAVFRDLPANTHIHFNGIISAASIAQRIGEERFNDRSAGSFWNVQVYTFIKLSPNAQFQSIVDKFPAFYDKYMKVLGDQIDASFQLKGTPIGQIHYHPKKLQWDAPTGEPKYLYILGSVGIFIMLIAAINYMNLATARSSRRSREVGMRKVSGASKSLLIRQFLSESVIIALMSMILALILVLLVLPAFNELAGKQFSLAMFFQLKILATLLGITVVVGLLAGLYPSFYLSSFNPVKILKGTLSNRTTGAGLRTILVVFQFMISAALIVGSLAVSSQLNYMQKKPLGFDKSNLIVLNIPDTTIQKNLEAFKQELEKSPAIIKTAAFRGGPGLFNGKQVMRLEGDNNEMEDHALNNYAVDYDYADLMGIKMDTGRFYRREMGSDTEKAFVVNQAATKEYNWGKNALGKRFHFGIDLEGPPRRDGEIVGVMEDFNYASLHNPVEPLVLILTDNNMVFGNLGIRYAEGKESEALSWIESVREDFNPYYPLDYFFLDEKLNESYKEEAIVNKVFRAFTILTLLVAALGLLGLSAFITQQKTKEIGIRKVVGSMPEQIIGLFLRKFLVWVLIANIIAFPIAYYFIINWLQDFHYRIDFNFFLFFWALLISSLVAIITVSYQSWKASRMQPANSLRYE
ncbi:MAG: ABC transporter permease [Bacteroidales bacterium]